MNATIANLILTRLGSPGWMHKVTGLTRPVTYKKGGPTEIVLPVACEVTDPLQCTVDRAYEVLPDEKYRSVVFFEGDTMPERVMKAGMGIQYRSTLRMVVWLNCDRLGGACNCGDLAYQIIVTALDSKMRYSYGVLLGIKHRVKGGPTRGREVFGRYTFDEKRSMYLHVPFDFFALDIETEFRVKPGCEDQLTASTPECWAPDPLPMKRYAKDFTCEELTDATNGLTDAQLGPECLDCGAGPCDPTTVNGTESATETITVLQGGVQVGTLNPATGVHTIPACDPLTVTLGGVEIVDEADPCGAAVVLECTDLVDAVVVEGAGTEAANGLYVRDGFRNGQPSYLSSANYNIHYEDFSGGVFYWSIEDDLTDSLYRTDTPGGQLFGRTWIVNNGSEPVPTVRQATIADICGGGACSDGSAVLKDTAGNTISTTPVPAGTTVDITAPDATVKTTDGVTTVQAIRSNASGNLPQSVIKYTDAANAAQVTAAADTEFATTLRPATVVPRRQVLNSAGNAANATYADLDDLISNTMPVAGDATAVIKNLNGTTLISEAIPANASENITAPIPLKFALAAGDDTSITWTVTDDEAGTYDTYTQDGASGTLTYSLNGGAFASLTGTIVLAVSDTIAVKRTTFSAAGFIKWAP